jgi:photosystem II stability/assembly factor-like uncharacterized protein
MPTPSIRWISLLLVSCFLAAPHLRSQDYWVRLDPPTQENLTKLHFLDSLTGWVVGSRGTIMKTTDGGYSWVFQDSRIMNEIVDIFMLNEDLGWALAHELPTDTGSSYGTIVLNTTDGGDFWENKMYPVEGEYFHSIEFLTPMEGWMGGEWGTLVGTTDGGLRWSEADVDSSLYIEFPIHNIKFFSSEYGYAVGGHYDIAGVIWRTTNKGQLWTIQGVNSEPLNGLFYFDSLNIISVGGDFDFGTGIVKTTNGGVDWEYVYPGIFGEAQEVCFRTRAEGWAPLGFTGTYMYTFDSARTWRDRFTPDSSAVYDIMFTDTLTGYMVGDNGTILKYKPVVVGVGSSPESERPLAGRLLQNYPNPFNPETVIRYELGVKSEVALVVYDMLGREVATLVREVQDAGIKSVKWDARLRPSHSGGQASGMASGVYFYRLHVDTGERGSFTQTKKLVLVR